MDRPQDPSVAAAEDFHLGGLQALQAFRFSLLDDYDEAGQWREQRDNERLEFVLHHIPVVPHWAHSRFRGLLWHGQWHL